MPSFVSSEKRGGGAAQAQQTLLGVTMLNAGDQRNAVEALVLLMGKGHPTFWSTQFLLGGLGVATQRCWKGLLTYLPSQGSGFVNPISVLGSSPFGVQGSSPHLVYGFGFYPFRPLQILVCHPTYPGKVRRSSSLEYGEHNPRDIRRFLQFNAHKRATSSIRSSSLELGKQISSRHSSLWILRSTILEKFVIFCYWIAKTEQNPRDLHRFGSSGNKTLETFIVWGVSRLQSAHSRVSPPKIILLCH